MSRWGTKSSGFGCIIKNCNVSYSMWLYNFGLCTQLDGSKQTFALPNENAQGFTHFPNHAFHSLFAQLTALWSSITFFRNIATTTRDLQYFGRLIDWTNTGLQFTRNTEQNTKQNVSGIEFIEIHQSVLSNLDSAGN